MNSPFCLFSNRTFTTPCHGIHSVFSIVSILGFLYCNQVSALSADGYILSQVDVETGNTQDAILWDNKADILGRAKFKTKEKKRTRGVFALDISAYKQEVTPSRLYVDYKRNKKLRFRMGYFKKKVGLEYEHHREERLAINRSRVYLKMKRNGLVGRQLGLNLRWRRNGSKRETYNLTMGYDGSRSANILVSANYHLQSIKGMYLGAWGLFEIRNKKKGQLLAVYAEALALWYQSKTSRFALELIHGVDPDSSYFELTFNDGRTIYFLSPRMDLSRSLFTNKRLTLELLFRTSIIFEDLINIQNNMLCFLGGIQSRFGRLILSLNAETMGVSDPNTPGKRRFEKRNFYAELAYFF